MDRYVKILKISWQAALVITCFMTVLSLLIPVIFKDRISFGQSEFSVYLFIPIILMLALVIFSDKYEKRRIKKLKKENLLTKIQKYKTIYSNQMLSYALISIVCFIMMLMLKSVGVIIFDAFAILLLVSNRPNSIKVKMDLELTNEELSKFNHIKFTVKNKEF